MLRVRPAAVVPSTPVCAHCGETRPNALRLAWVRLYDDRHEQRWECRSRKRCWARWNARHLPSSVAQSRDGARQIHRISVEAR